MRACITFRSAKSSGWLHAAILLYTAIVCGHAGALPAASPAQREPTRRVLVENRTYSPLWYRTQGGGRWSQWRALLPGERHWYDEPRVTIEASLVGGPRKFALQAGNTYYLHRPWPHGDGKFSADPWDAGRGGWRVPKPPQANEFTFISRASSSTGGGFLPLERFVDRCERFRDEYQLSLTELVIACAISKNSTGKIAPELRQLKGFTWFFGYWIDPRTDDVILLGVRDETRPPIDLDCLVTAMLAAHERRTPACSLDAHPDPRFQKSVIRGIPWNSKWAEIMIDADYDMKKICQGHLDPKIAGLTPWFDNVIAELRSTHTKSQENRWWFNLDASLRRAMVSRNGDTVVLYRNPVRISTEKNIAGEYGTGARSPAAERFAYEFTLHMDELGEQYTSIGQLLALFRLYDLMCHLRICGHKSAPGIDYWTTQYRSPHAGPPDKLPTLSRSKRLKEGNTVFTFSIKGGVAMHVPITSETKLVVPAGTRLSPTD